MRVLVLTRIFPNQRTPGAAPFLRLQCRALAEQCDLLVYATLPWLPFNSLWSRWSYWGEDFSSVPQLEQIDGLEVYHPRFLQVPKFAAPNAALYATSLYRRLRELRPRPDVILSTWAYPDGVAALLLGRALKIPTAVQVIGSDVNVVAQLRGARRQLGWTLPRAGAVIAVSRQLGRQMVEMGAPSQRVHVICTGIDRSLFRVRDQEQARKELRVPVEAKVILFVGRLSREKGVTAVLDAFASLAAHRPEYRLVLIGTGPAQEQCEAQRARFGNRVLLTGQLEADAVARWLTACNVLTLPSHSEGTPNVVLEALSSGRRVVATPVGGIVDLIQGDTQGKLVPVGSTSDLCEALQQVADHPYPAAEVSASVDLYDWSENARRILRVLERMQ